MRAQIKKILKWSEKYTKTDMVYLTKGGFWLMLGHGIQVLSGLIMALAFANLLPKESYGTYQFIIATAAILSAFTLSGMGIAIKRAVARGHEGAMQHGFRTQFIWSSGIVIAGGILSIYYFLKGNNDLAQAFLIVGALSPFIEGFSLYRAYLIGTQRFRESTLLGLWRRPIFIIAVLISLLFTDDPIILIFVYFFSSAVSAGLLYNLTVHKYKLKSIPNQELENYSKHLSIMGIVTRIANNADKILIFHFLGAAPVAVYTLAMLPSTHVLKLFELLGDLAFTKFAHRSIHVLESTLPWKVFQFFLTSVGLVIIYILVAPYLYAIFFPTFSEAVLLSQVAILSLLAKPRMLYDQVFIAQAMKRAQYFIRISSAAIKLTSLFILVPAFGLWGAIFAVLTTQLFLALANFSVFRYLSLKNNL